MLAPSQARTGALVAIAVVAGVVGVARSSRSGESPAAAAAAKVRFPITDAQRDGRLRFAPTVSGDDRQTVLNAISSARPEARRLVDVVDGAVTIRVGSAGRGIAGLTRATPAGFEVTLDIGQVGRYGFRAIRRLVLHELGHVVDFALVSRELGGRLDAEIPRGYACPPGQPISGCAPPDERFAETFAKWATGDLGFYIPLGYAVAPPSSLNDWGAPLAALAREQR